MPKIHQVTSLVNEMPKIRQGDKDMKWQNYTNCQTIGQRVQQIVYNIANP